MPPAAAAANGAWRSGRASGGRARSPRTRRRRPACRPRRAPDLGGAGTEQLAPHASPPVDDQRGAELDDDRPAHLRWVPSPTTLYCRSQRSRYVTGPRGPGTQSTLMPVSGAPVSAKPSVKRVGACQNAAVPRYGRENAARPSRPRRRWSPRAPTSPRSRAGLPRRDVDDVDRDGGNVVRVVRPLVSEPEVVADHRGVLRAARCPAASIPSRSSCSTLAAAARGRGAVDEQQVEPVADAEPIETGLDHRLATAGSAAAR